MGRVDIRKIRKDEIVLVARKLVARKGWQNTTLADIAREAGVSLGVITYHFTNKDDQYRHGEVCGREPRRAVCGSGRN
jgi:AcrR family transcriptional regulator